MAYENSGMLGLVSPGGRGYLAGEQQGLTPEQMAQNGAITFAEAIALKQKADRMRASMAPMQAQQQQTPKTVVDELNAQVMQGAGQVQPSPDMSAMIAGNAARYARGGGITTLPANVGNYNMASGGIVAFSGQGPSLVEGSDGTEQNYSSEFDYLQRLKTQARARGDLAAIEQINTAISAALRAGGAQNRQKIFEAFTNPYIEGARNIREFGLPPKDAETVPGSAALTPAPATPPDTDPLRKLEYVGGAGTRNRATFPGVMDEPPPVPPESENEAIYKQADELLKGGRGVSAPRLNAASLFPDVRVSQAEQDKIKGDLRAEGEASGLPALLRRGTERVGTEIEGAKKGMTKDLWLAAAQAGFGIAGSTDPFLTAAGKAGQQFAGQYAVINKDMKKEARELNKDKESYQRAMAEFELNQNSETRKRVDMAQNRIESRQDKQAELTMKQADLDFRAAIADQGADTQRRGMKLQALLARVKNPEKVTLQSAFAEAALRNDTVTMDRLVAAAGRMSDVSSTVVAARINAARQAAGQGGPNMFGNNFEGFEIVPESP